MSSRTGASTPKNSPLIMGRFCAYAILRRSSMVFEHTILPSPDATTTPPQLHADHTVTTCSNKQSSWLARQQVCEYLLHQDYSVLRLELLLTGRESFLKQQQGQQHYCPRCSFDSGVYAFESTDGHDHAPGLHAAAQGCVQHKNLVDDNEASTAPNANRHAKRKVDAGGMNSTR